MTRLKNCLQLLLIVSGCFGYKLYTNNKRTQFIDVESEKCTLYIEEQYTKALTSYEHEVLSDEKFNTMFQDCFDRAYKDSAITRPFIFPGTNWCGVGTIAQNINDLGVSVKEDACCRQHDLCPLYIGISKCEYDVCNSWVHTISHCNCDLLFHDCLKQVNSTSADVIGALYFDLLHTSCFYEEEGSPKCPLIEGDPQCHIKLTALTYTREDYIADLPEVMATKKNFFQYLSDRV